jgi:hypothetical protein
MPVVAAHSGHPSPASVHPEQLQSIKVVQIKMQNFNAVLVIRTRNFHSEQDLGTVFIFVKINPKNGVVDEILPNEIS